MNRTQTPSNELLRSKEVSIDLLNSMIYLSRRSVDLGWMIEHQCYIFIPENIRREVRFVASHSIPLVEMSPNFPESLIPKIISKSHARWAIFCHHMFALFLFQIKFHQDLFLYNTWATNCEHTESVEVYRRNMLLRNFSSTFSVFPLLWVPAT